MHLEGPASGAFFRYHGAGASAGKYERPRQTEKDFASPGFLFEREKACDEVIKGLPPGWVDCFAGTRR